MADKETADHIIPILQPAMEAYLAGFPGRDRITIRMFGKIGPEGGYRDIAVGTEQGDSLPPYKAIHGLHPDPVRNALRCLGVSSGACDLLDGPTAARVIERKLSDYSDAYALEMIWWRMGMSRAILRDLNAAPAQSAPEGRHTMQGDLLDITAYLSLSL